MFPRLTGYRRALALSIVFHLVVIAAILLNFHLSGRPNPVKQSELAKTVKAEIVDQQQLDAQINRKKKEQEAKRKSELEKQKRAKEAKKREAEKNRKQVEEKKRKIAQEKKKQEEAKRIAEAKTLAEQKKKQQETLKKQQEVKKQEELKKQLAAEKQQKLAEEKRKREEKIAREAEKKRLEAERLKQEADKRRLAEEDQKRRQQELNENLKAEESQQKLNLLREAYRLAIQQKIHRNWLKPPDSGKIPICKVKVIQGPAGIILDVTVGACPGVTPTYRASIENAVYKADPLPKPGDPSLFERELIILFNPG